MRLIVNLALLVTSTGFALGVIEVAMRLRNWYPPPPNPIVSRQSGLYRAHDEMGYTLWPGKDTTYRYPRDAPYELRVKANADGFREDRELGERDGRPRVLVLGDSFVFGDGVREEDRLTEVLERLEPGWRVDNAGMTGWGLDLMIRALEHVGPRADPDVVVLAVYTDDFRRLLPYYAGVGFAYPKFELENGALVTRPFPYPGLVGRMRLVQWIYRSHWRANRNRYDLNGALLGRFLANAGTLGFLPVVAYLPGKGDTDEDRERRAFLADWTSRHGVPYVDLQEPFNRAGIDETYIANNWHWNAEGHRIAAEALRRALLNVLPPAPEPVPTTAQ